MFNMTQSFNFLLSLYTTMLSALRALAIAFLFAPLEANTLFVLCI
jgi:hypothetical protein